MCTCKFCCGDSVHTVPCKSICPLVVVTIGPCSKWVMQKPLVDLNPFCKKPSLMFNNVYDPTMNFIAYKIKACTLSLAISREKLSLPHHNSVNAYL